MLNCFERPVASEQQQVGSSNQQIMASAQLTASAAGSLIGQASNIKTNHYYHEQSHNDHHQQQQHCNYHHQQQMPQTCNEMIDGPSYQFGAHQPDPQQGATGGGGGGQVPTSSVPSHQQSDFSNLEFNQLFANETEDEFRISNGAGLSRAGSGNNSPSSQAALDNHQAHQQRHGISALARLEGALDSQMKAEHASIKSTSTNQQLDHFLLAGDNSLGVVQGEGQTINMLHDTQDNHQQQHHQHHHNLQDHHQQELYNTHARWDQMNDYNNNGLVQGSLHSTTGSKSALACNREVEELDYYQMSQYSYGQQANGGVSSSELLASSSSSSSDNSPAYGSSEQQSHSNQHLHYDVQHSNNGHQEVPNHQHQPQQQQLPPPQQQANFDGSSGYANATSNFQDYYQSVAPNYQCDPQQQQQQPNNVCYNQMDKGDDQSSQQHQHYDQNNHFIQNHSTTLIESHQEHSPQDGRSYQQTYNYHQQEPIMTTTTNKSYTHSASNQQQPETPAAITTTRSSNASVDGGDLLVASQLALGVNNRATTFPVARDKPNSGQQTKITTTTTTIGRGRQLRGRPRKKKSSAKGKVSGKLWEFIRDLLLSECTNPSFIRWERREDGVFKFVQSDKVAKMWGERKQNPKMTYEKLSRAMRYYYKSKVLLPVFGRRLVYKFGPNATGWMSASQQQQFDQNKLQQQQQQQQHQQQLAADAANETNLIVPTSVHLTLSDSANMQHQPQQQHNGHTITQLQPFQPVLEGFY